MCPARRHQFRVIRQATLSPPGATHAAVSLAPFDPRSDEFVQDNLGAMRLDDDLPGIHLRVALEKPPQFFA
jgi:hypothetical protein